MNLANVTDSHASAIQQATFAYGTHQRQVLDAYWNESPTPRAGLILIHGGSWNNGERGGGWADTARWYADRGLATFSIDHRFNTDVAWPGPQDDVLAAIDWIKTEAARFDLDPTKLVIMGSQAGGHLATAAGTYGAGGSTVRGVIGLSAIVSPYRAWGGAPDSTAADMRRRIRDNAVILTRCHPSDKDQPCWNRWNDAVTKTRASADDAPMYLLTGQHDPYVSTGHADDLATALQAKGVPVTTETVEGSASGGYLLTDVTKPKTLAWIKARTEDPAPVSARPAATPHPTPTPQADVDGIRGAARVFPAPQADPPTEATHAYGSHPRQQLDSYHHPDVPPQPALIIVHGGHWYEGDKQDWAATARWFAAQGYATFSVNYRLNTDAAWPAQRDDLDAAVAWIRQNANTFNVDPDRILMLGSSAGGHLATIAGTHGKGTELLRGVVALSPVADPNLGYNDGQTKDAIDARVKLRDNATLLTRCHPDSNDIPCSSRWADTAAKNQAGAGDVPMYLIHSQQDFVPASHSIALCAPLTQANVPCSTEIAPGSGHGGELFEVTGLRDKVLTWLKSHE